MHRKSPPVNIATPEFLQQLAKIDAGVWGTPISVELVDGQFFDVCLAWENPRFSDKGDWINPQQVQQLRECTSRMPAQFAVEIRNAGESGMGYHIYVVELDDGTSFVHVAGNLAIDLLNLPPGYTHRNVTKVRPHEGRELSNLQHGFRQIDRFHSIEYARFLAAP